MNINENLYKNENVLSSKGSNLVEKQVKILRKEQVYTDICGIK